MHLIGLVSNEFTSLVEDVIIEDDSAAERLPSIGTQFLVFHEPEVGARSAKLLSS